MSASEPKSDWKRLFRIAHSFIQHVNSEQPIIDHWSFGGGTAMMLQIGHRESHDIDIFLSDPQLLGFLDPQKANFKFEIEPTDFSSDGARFSKIAFEGIGEIDFIVAGPMTSMPTTPAFVEGHNVLLDTVTEIVVKKVHYRGASIKPRDIFDIAAAAEQNANSIITELSTYESDVAATLATLDRLKPTFVNAAIADLMIKDEYLALAETSLDRTKEVLRSVKSAK